MTARSAMVVGIVACAVALSACGEDEEAARDADAMQDKTKAKDAPQRARNGNLTREGYSVTTNDLNRDERPDQWTLGGEGGVVRVERDLNFDGRVDVWQYPGQGGQVLEEEMDLDHDGRVDVVAYYREDGSVERKELALQFGTQFTVFKFYDTEEALLRVEHDEDADGIVDRWDYYENKRVVRTGWDEDGDGVPDKFDKLPQ